MWSQQVEVVCDGEASTTESGRKAGMRWDKRLTRGNNKLSSAAAKKQPQATTTALKRARTTTRKKYVVHTNGVNSSTDKRTNKQTVLN